MDLQKFLIAKTSDIPMPVFCKISSNVNEIKYNFM